MAGPWSICSIEARVPCCGTKEQFLSKDSLAEEGFTVHAGADEHSQLFYLRPDLIAPDFVSAPSLTARTFEDHVTIAKAAGWPGYFGAPRLATAAMGAQEFQKSAANLVKVALQILDGLDPRTVPRYADEMDPLNTAGEQQQLDREKAVEQREQAWLAQHKLQ